MNQIRLILVGIAGMGIVLIILGMYIALKADTPAVQSSPATVTASSHIPAATPVQTPVRITSKTVTVPSTVMWYDTGIDVPTNATVRIEYKGGHWTNVAGTNFVDGRGKQYDRRDLLIVPQSYLASLVAKVGSYSFHVGNSYSGKPGTGRLYLAMNDVPKTYNDNDGELDVIIEGR